MQDPNLIANDREENPIEAFGSPRLEEHLPDFKIGVLVFGCKRLSIGERLQIWQSPVRTPDSRLSLRLGLFVDI